jgi:hypothetical protein
MDNNMSTQGQILDGSNFATWIDKIITNHKPNVIVEIGTWKGLGSTKRIIDSIVKNDLNCEFMTLESNLNFFEIAKSNLNQHINIVNLVWGRIVDRDDIMSFVNQNTITEEMMGWLDGDLKDYLICDNVMSQIPEHIDFLLLDGGEFSTYEEWKKLKDRTKIVALDDTKVLKSKQIREELLTNPDYEKIVDSEDRNGFAIFKRI